MGRAHGITLACCFVLGWTMGAAAQEPLPPSSTLPSSPYASLSPAQDRELSTWLTAMEKWQQYEAKWRNRPARDGWGRIVERQRPPAAPAWLEAHCAAAAAAGVVTLDPRTRVACRLIDDARAFDAAVPSAVQAAETPKHSSFLTRVHFDFLSTTTSTGDRLYGIVGSHISLVDVGRLQIFGPPGVILLSAPDSSGGRRTTLGYTWGVSVRLTDMRLGAPTKNVTLFLNVTKVWVGGGTLAGGAGGSYDIIGLSLAPRRER
jgi:hypothetical protein